jgi:transposase-like protein
MIMAEKIYKRYSMAFKKHIVASYEAGTSINALTQRYGITGATTIKRWVAQYGREGIRHKMVIIQHPEEQNQLRELQAELKQMKELVAKLSLEKFVLECTLAVAEEDLGYEVKKKIPIGLSNKPEPTTKRPRSS